MLPATQARCRPTEPVGYPVKAATSLAGVTTRQASCPKWNVATLEALRDRGSTVPVLVLTTFDDDELVLTALRAGARGYLLKDVTLDQLVGAIRTLAAGGTLLQPALTDRLLRAVSQRPTAVTGIAQPNPLTDRELDVLRLLAAGHTNLEIASALHLAAGTVKNHVSGVLLKLGVRDRTRAVLRALDLGLLDAG